ncbi:hypothetical protein ACWEOW_04410 [Monashia sp. NPDC004114]
MSDQWASRSGSDAEPSERATPAPYGATADDYVAGASACPLPGPGGAPGPKKGRRVIVVATLGAVLIGAPTFLLTTACSTR